jgi:hypothetical protein
VKVVDPVAPARAGATEQRGAPALAPAGPVTVGFLDNGWPSWQAVIESMSDRLATECIAAATRRWPIPVSTPADPQLLAEVVRVCDLVVVGLGN